MGRSDILIVEDEAAIRGFVRINLERRGFHVREAASGEEALKLVAETEPQLMVLDLKLPGIDGFEVCKFMRDNYPQVAIIMLTAKGQDLDRVMGLEMGADDYLVKPFNPLELTARVRAVLRRTTSFAKPPSGLRFGDLEILIEAKKVTKAGRPVELTPKEYDLLHFLAQHPDRVLSRDELLDQIWGLDYVGDPKTVDVHVRRLRAKIEDDPSHPVFLETVWGTGYRWRGTKP